MITNRSLILSAGVCTALAALAGVSGSRAQSTPSRPAPGERTTTTTERSTSAAPADIRAVVVTVKAVDRAQHKVTFEAKVSPEANLMKNGAPIKIDQLEKGDSLRMLIDPRTGEVVKAEVIKYGPPVK